MNNKLISSILSLHNLFIELDRQYCWMVFLPALQTIGSASRSYQQLCYSAVLHRLVSPEDWRIGRLVSWLVCSAALPVCWSVGRLVPLLVGLLYCTAALYLVVSPADCKIGRLSEPRLAAAIKFTNSLYQLQLVQHTKQWSSQSLSDQRGGNEETLTGKMKMGIFNEDVYTQPKRFAPVSSNMTN